MKKIDINTIQQINLFEKITRAKLKDIIIKQDTILYIIHPNQIGKAIGKKAINIKKLTNITKKRIKIIEFNTNPINFIKNFINPIKPTSIEKTNNLIKIQADKKTKGLLIGRNQQNLKTLNNTIKEYFNLEVKVK